MGDGPQACAVCGSARLALALRVAGDPGPDGLIPTTDRFGVALSDLVRCGSCRHVQLARMPARAELDSAYGDAESTDYLAEEPGQRQTARTALDQIEAALSGDDAVGTHAAAREAVAGEAAGDAAVGDDGLVGGGLGGSRRLLDLGCWVGFLLDEARTRGWDGVGIEPSAFASAYARDRFRLDVRTGDLLDAPLEPGSFDAVVLGDVIEHLVDPAAALRRVRTLLRPGGVVWMALPDAGSPLAAAMGSRWWSVLPTHVHYFSRDSLRLLLTRGGFSVLSVQTAPKAFSVRYYLDRLGGYSPPVASALVAAASATGLADRLWAPDFGDRIAVLARRLSD